MSGSKAMAEGDTRAEGNTKADSNTKIESETKSVGAFKRFLTRREKGSSDWRKSWFFSFDKKKKKGLEDERKIQSIVQRLSELGAAGASDTQIEQALNGRYANGDIEKAVKLLLVYEDAVDGVIREARPTTKFVGAENRAGVTCYIDALLFAMFAKLDTFDAMLYNQIDDEPRRTLSILLRVWVNMLRSGMLITEDITQKLQSSLSDCGWKEAGKLRQQDTSEAFTFISGKLGLPQLTFKVDIYHTGKEEDTADHKFVNEQLLEVAVPNDPGNGLPIPLEIPLENYFNNQIEIKRYLQRRDTKDPEKATFSYIEFSGITSDAYNSSPMSQYPPSPLPLYSPSPLPLTPRRLATSATTATISEEPSPVGPTTTDEIDSVVSETGTQSAPSQPPTTSRNRAQSIIREVVVEEGEAPGDNGTGLPQGRTRKSSIRKQVDMPAWQFFRLLPWYNTANGPTSDAQVADHFALKRPILGICLKRYGVDADGKLTRINTRIDIPLEIRFPHFIQDEKPENDGPLGNFKLVLQSVVCHRGTSLNGGHYITLARGDSSTNGQKTNEEPNSQDIRDGDGANDMWLKFDDMDAAERVRPVNIKEALDKEMPYLLFYQIQPIDEELPPLYDSGSTGSSLMAPLFEVEDSELSSLVENTLTVVQPVNSLASGDGQVDSEVTTCSTSPILINMVKEDTIVTTTKEVQVPLANENSVDALQVKEKKSKKRKDRSKGKDKEKSKGEIPDRQCLVM
ncbi:hypothetical protein FGG08_005817 [Glutinoglossum americanum]|uniref:ubiquitinyl hydrolase 1 n=1 Tax=Glutinoglossum americanum TaxID=1670608 RepID=A0A9P8I2J2_9PEZI|nr:hypothetical protein FGG08_005817 [Glutinoglossum americanum]